MLPSGSPAQPPFSASIMSTKHAPKNCPPTQQIVDASRAARRALMSEVLGELDDDQMDSLAKGLEVLDTMTRLLQERR